MISYILVNSGKFILGLNDGGFDESGEIWLKVFKIQLLNVD